MILAFIFKRSLMRVTGTHVAYYHVCHRKSALIKPLNILL